MAGRGAARSRGGGGGLFRIRAFAKINLDLRILGTLPGGYHELRTTFQSIALDDALTFAPIAGGRIGIECDDAACPTDRTNLVWKAATLAARLAPKRAREIGVRISIAKVIPMQAGLGGGSSDAAATLRACRRLWRLPSGELPALASSIGADVAFFLRGGTAVGIGRGDRIRPLPDAAPAWVVLVLPDFGVSTNEAYGWWDESNGREARRAALPAVRSVTNDLEAPVAARHPRIGRIVQALGRAGASTASMSGSGSAVFGLFRTRTRAEAAAERLRHARQRVIVTRTLGLEKYRLFSKPTDLPAVDSLV